MFFYGGYNCVGKLVEIVICNDYGCLSNVLIMFLFVIIMKNDKEIRIFFRYICIFFWFLNNFVIIVIVFIVFV